MSVRWWEKNSISQIPYTLFMVTTLQTLKWKSWDYHNHQMCVCQWHSTSSWIHIPWEGMSWKLVWRSPQRGLVSHYYSLILSSKADLCLKALVCPRMAGWMTLCANNDSWHLYSIHQGRKHFWCSNSFHIWWPLLTPYRQNAQACWRTQYWAIWAATTCSHSMLAYLVFSSGDGWQDVMMFWKRLVKRYGRWTSSRNS